MTFQPNSTMKPNAKSSMYIEYSNLIKGLEQYIPQFKVSIKDLQEPSQTFVTNFYTDVFTEFFCDVNNLTEIQVDQHLTYNEMFGEIVPILNMCNALRYIYSKLGMDDFGLNDICDPSSKRTYRLLQTMINFIKYSDDKINATDDKMKFIRNMKDTIDKLKKQKDIILNSINQKSLDRKERAAEFKIVVDDIEVSSSELLSIQKLRDELLKELDKVRQGQEEINKTCSKLCEQKDHIIRDINAFRAQIVEAPDLLKADHERFKRKNKEITEKKSVMMAQISAKKQTVIILEQELLALEKRLRLLTDVIEKNKSLSQLNHDIETMVQKYNELKESSDSLKTKREIIERDRTDINNKINNFVNEVEQETNIYNSKFNSLNKEKEERLKQKDNYYDFNKSLEDEINKCNLRKNELEDYVSSVMKNFEAAKTFLNKQQNILHTKIIQNGQYKIKLFESGK